MAKRKTAAKKPPALSAKYRKLRAETRKSFRRVREELDSLEAAINAAGYCPPEVAEGLQALVRDAQTALMRES